jgi:anthranilate synthase component I
MTISPPASESAAPDVASAGARPYVRELPADLLTPVAAYLRLRDLGPGFLLESIERGQQVGRYSFLAAGCTVRTAPAGGGFADLRALLGLHAGLDRSGLPPFAGGIVGHLIYDEVASFEPSVPLPPPREDDPVSSSRFLEVPVVVAFDHVRARLFVIAVPGAEARADEYVARLLGPQPVGGEPVEPVEPAPTEGLTTPEAYAEMVRAAQRHIRAGDAFQVVPSQRHVRATTRSPFAVYRALRSVNPSPYMFFVDFGHAQGEVALVGASPETHVSLDAHRVAALKPIAGSRPRGATPAEDDRLAAELATDEKERAEHLMLVDLARNDLSRVCRPGTVRPSQLLETERYSHIMHLVSRVEGVLEDDQDAFSLLRATFPAGTVSGAPKVRAMQIITSLEERRRGAYAGAVGYLGYDGSLDTCIALRTIVMRDGRALLQAGAGIVADSIPESEHRECMTKIAALSAAIDLADEGVYGA